VATLSPSDIPSNTTFIYYPVTIEIAYNCPFCGGQYTKLPSPQKEGGVTSAVSTATDEILCEDGHQVNMESLTGYYMVEET